MVQKQPSTVGNRPVKHLAIERVQSIFCDILEEEWRHHRHSIRSLLKCVPGELNSLRQAGAGGAGQDLDSGRRGDRSCDQGFTLSQTQGRTLAGSACQEHRSTALALQAADMALQPRDVGMSICIKWSQDGSDHPG